MALAAGPIPPYSPQPIDFPTSVPKAALMPYLQYIPRLSEIQQYTVAQYTFHGDIMLNALLRGIDSIQTYEDNIPKPDDLERFIFQFEPSCLFLYILAPDLASLEYFKTIQPKLHRRVYYLLDIGARDNGQVMNHLDESIKGTNFRRGVSTAEFRAHKRSVFERYRHSIYPELKTRLDNGDLNYFREKTYDAFKVIFEAVQGISRHIPYDPTDAPRKLYRGVSHFYIPRERRPFAINSFLSTSVDETVAGKFADRATGGIYEFLCFSDVPSLYLTSLSRFPTEFEMLFCPGVKLQYLLSSTRPDGLKVDTYALLKPDSSSPVGTRIPDLYDDYKSWEQTLEVGRTPVRPGEQVPLLGLPANANAPPLPLAVPVAIQPALVAAASPPPLPASPRASPRVPDETNSIFNLYAGGSRRRLRNRGGGVNPTRKNKTQKKLTKSSFQRTRNTTMSDKPFRIPGDRWDSKLPIKYTLLELTKEDEKALERIKEFIVLSKKKEYHDT
jgi:hypothetical protein